MEKKYTVVKLLKNHLYPTYQLYAEMNSRKLSLQDGLKYGVLTVLSWLRSRLGDEIAAGLALPEPQDYKNIDLKDLVSLHINQGYVVDIISLPEKGIWTLQITEPDLGPNPGTLNQSRQPVPGRIIETNVGFTINEDSLTMGVQTVISDPENSALAEVYRPAFVRTLYLDDNFGLKQVLPLKNEIYYINTSEQLENFFALANNLKHQLPCVLFTYQKKISCMNNDVKTYLTLTDIAKDPKGKFTGTFDHKFIGKVPKTDFYALLKNIQLENKEQNIDLSKVKKVPSTLKRVKPLL